MLNILFWYFYNFCHLYFITFEILPQWTNGRQNIYKSPTKYWQFISRRRSYFKIQFEEIKGFGMFPNKQICAASARYIPMHCLLICKTCTGLHCLPLLWQYNCTMFEIRGKVWLRVDFGGKLGENKLYKDMNCNVSCTFISMHVMFLFVTFWYDINRK